MSFAYGASLRVLALALGAAGAAAAAGCASDEGAPTKANVAATVTPGALRFEVEGGILQIKPGSHVTLSLVGPPTTARARVWLDGDYLDGSLDKSEVDLAGGSARLVLAAPTSPAIFTVRARVGEATARLPVSVSANGFAQLRVKPEYSGPRLVPSLTASVFVTKTCKELASVALGTDGDLSAQGNQGVALVIASVPAAAPVSVRVRIERYAEGCVDVQPVPVASSLDIAVKLYDRPLDYARNFAVELRVEPDATELDAWKNTVAPVAEDWVTAFIGTAAMSEADWLLDAMAEAATAATPGAGAELASARAAGGWDAKTATWLAAHAPTIRTRASGFVSEGTKTPPTPLAFALSPAVSPNQAQALPKTLAGRSLANGWISSPAPFDWIADASDVLKLSGAMSVKPGALLGLGADVGAKAAGAADFPTAIASGIDCAGLAQLLVGAGTSYGTCDAACTGQLCKTAIARREQQASGTLDAKAPLSLGITSTAKPVIGPDADVRSFEGTWAGTVQATPAPFGLHGGVSGIAE